MLSKKRVKELEAHATYANQCPHLPQLITYWEEQKDGTLTPSETMRPDLQREPLPYNPMRDTSLTCSCGRERMQFKIVQTCSRRHSR